MTVAPVITETVYALAGSSLGPFNTVWPYAEDADVSAYLDYGPGPQLLANGSDYTLADLVILETGGQVTLSGNLLVNGAWPAGTILTLARGTAVGQPSSFGQSQALSPLGMMAAIDNLSRQVQELKTAEGRMVGAAYGEGGFNLPPAATRQGKLAFFSAGTGQLVGMSAALFTVTEQQTVFGTLVLAGAAQIAGAAEWILTLGCNAAGDAGGGVYKRMGGAPVAPTRASFQSDDGAWWLYTPDARGVNWRAFGADPAGVGECHAAIQDAIDFSVYIAKCKSYGVGIFKTSDTLHLGYGVSFESGTIEGDGYVYAGQTGFRGTAIMPTFSDRPALNIQGGRGSVVHGVAFVGQNLNWIVTNKLGISPGAGTALVDDTVLDNWIDPGLTGGVAQADGQYTPYAAITIDAYAGAQPGSHLPAVTYPAWLATLLNGGVAYAQYNKDFSSDTAIEGCYISGFVGCIAIQPCNADGNGDFVKVRGCNFVSNAWLLSAGNSQGRNLEWLSNVCVTFHTGFLNAVHGRQIGKIEGSIVNSSFDNCTQWFDIGAPFYAGPLVFVGCYGEANWRIGNWGTGVVSPTLPLKFIACNWLFNNQSLGRGIPATLLTANDPAQISFDSGAIDEFWSVATLAAFAKHCSIDNTQFLNNQSPRTNTYQQIAHNALAGGLLFQPDSKNNRPQRFSTCMQNRYNLDTGVASQTEGMAEACGGNRTLNHCSHSPYLAPELNGQQRYLAPNQWSSATKASFSAAALAPSTETAGIMLTITQPGGIDPNAHGLMPGDVMVDDITLKAFFIRSNTAGVIIAELQSGYANPTGAAPAEIGAAINLATGNWYSLNARLYTPQYPTIGTIATGNANITSAGRGDGYNGYLGAGGDIQIGDAPFIDQTVDHWNTATSNPVTADAGGTITLTDNNIYAMANKPLPAWIRAAPANM